MYVVERKIKRVREREKQGGRKASKEPKGRACFAFLVADVSKAHKG